MPAVTLVVCVHLQRDLLERLIRESHGCYDELLVLHDTPDVQDVRSVVEAAGGRFFEMPSVPFQELHWPFAWGQARHDWILRFDTDEFPSAEMKTWLKHFRQAPETPPDLTGYTCIWPLWDGSKMVSKKWPAGRPFLFNKNQVRFFGMCEQMPLPDGKYQPLDFILHHQPKRKSYGLWNALIRGQSARIPAFIGKSLLGKPTDLNCWRWTSDAWPLHWEQIRQRPLWTAFKRLVKGTVIGLRDQWQVEKRLFPLAAISGPIHLVMTCVVCRRVRRQSKRQKIEGKPRIEPSTTV